MDSSISGDPGAPDSDFDPARIKRWRRLGATNAEIEQLRSFPAETVSDADLGEALDRLRGTGPVEAPVDTTPSAADIEVRKRHDADHGEWIPGGALTVDGVVHRLFTLAYGYVGALVGDERNGIHLVAKDVDEMESKIKRLTRVRVYQSQKSAANAKAKASA